MYTALSPVTIGAGEERKRGVSDQVTTIEPRALAQRLAGDDPPLVLDVREPWEIAICRIEGSRNIPMGEVPAARDLLERSDPVVVVCHHGMRSAQVCQYLSARGVVGAVANLAGGIDAWAREVDPSMARY